MVDEPFLEDLGAALPVDVAASAREEAGHRVPAEVVDPAFLAELPHQGVDPGEACLAELPALEPLFRQRGIDDVVACDEAVGRVDLGGEMPGDEANVGVVVGLGEGPAEGGLCGEVHVSEEELADQVCGDCGGFLGVGGFVNDFLDAVVEKADGEGTEVMVRGEQGSCLRGESGRCRGGFGKSGGVVFVGYDGVECGESDGFAAPVRGAGWFEAQFRHGGNGEVVVGAREGGVGCFLAGTLDAIYVGVWGRLGLLEFDGEITGIWKRFWCRERLGDVAQLFGSLGLVSTG